MEVVKLLEKCFIQISNFIRNENSLHLSNLVNLNNNSGDDVKSLDIISNEILKKILSKCPLIRTIGSEEDDELLQTEYTNAPYLLCFDPLDGSSNIDVNITTGTIFCLYKYELDGSIKNGHNIVLSGYCLYGGATQYLLAYENKLSFYQFKSEANNFELECNNLIIKSKGNIYSLNESNKYLWTDNRFNKLSDLFIQQKYSSRWVGSLVADAHRTIIKGGFFAYPGNKKDINGKIRLLYEAYPFAHIFSLGGGFSSNGEKNILDIDFPKNIHQKTPIVLSSKYEFNLFNTI
jgi:fructose-1,6-bisphosphatase I